MLKEFKPAFTFLGKFLGIYILGNLAYGLYIESFDNHQVDPITEVVTEQTSTFLNAAGEHTSCSPGLGKPTVSLEKEGRRVLNVYEGCNGINVMIVFVAFVVAFGGAFRSMLWFIGVGLILLHLANIARISLLYYTALEYREYLYYMHKYFFTGILYLIVFLLWAIWIFKFNVKGGKQQHV